MAEVPALVHPTTGRTLAPSMPMSAPPPSGGALTGSTATSRMRAGLSGTGSLTPYDAADPWSQELQSWTPYLGSPDTDGNPYRNFIVSRLRDMVRNDGWAAGSVTAWLDNVIGAGFRFIAKPDWRALSLEASGFDPVWAREYQNVVQAELRLWAEDVGKNCDLSRRMSWKEMSRLGARTLFVEGDAIGVTHWRPNRVLNGTSRFGTCVQIVDPDRLSNPFGFADSQYLRGGVQIDDDGVAVAYQFRCAHPAQYMERDKTFRWEPVARETPWGRPNVVHYFDGHRADQHRGFGGVLTPVLARLKMLARYDSVELQAAIINAVLAAYIESPQDQDTVNNALETQLSGGDPKNSPLGVYEELRAQYHDVAKIKLNGARVPRLFQGEKIHLAAPTRPAQQFAAFEGAMLRNVAAATGLSYTQISKDYSQTNYSSERAAMIETYKNIGRVRLGFGEGFCLPILGCVIEEMFAGGRVPLPRNAPPFAAMRTAYTRARLLGPGRGWIDPVREAQAAVMRMDAGLTTLEDECGEQGGDWEEVLYTRAVTLALYRELNLPLPKWSGAAVVAQSPDAHQLAEKPQAV